MANESNLNSPLDPDRLNEPTRSYIDRRSPVDLDRDGAFISPNHILGLVFDYLLETRGYKLGDSRSVATTHRMPRPE